MEDHFSRRQAIKALSGSLAGAGPAATVAHAGESTPAASSNPQGVCVLFPRAVEGPYYFDPNLVRSDITEGRPGLPIALQLRVIEGGSCKSLSGARVDIWHADAGGVYSGYAGQGDDRNLSAKGQHYLRGTQFTDADGRVAFTSIFPGWYPGRTPHIHVKVFLNEKTLVTGQIYFENSVSERIYAAQSPYNSRPVPDTTNRTDRIFQQGKAEGGGTVFSVSDEGSGMTAALLIAVEKTASGEHAASGWRNWLKRLLGRDRD